MGRYLRLSVVSTTSVRALGSGPSAGRSMLGRVMDDAHVDGMRRGFVARRVRMPSSGVESWTVVGPDARPVGLADEFLGWLTGLERSPNTVEASSGSVAHAKRRAHPCTGLRACDRS